MEILKNIGLGFCLIAVGLSLVIGITFGLCYLGMLVLGPGYEAAGPTFALVLFGSWLVGTAFRN